MISEKKYTINVKTGDVSGAGTDANVFLIVYGDLGDSGEHKLHKSETYTDKFERGHVGFSWLLLGHIMSILDFCLCENKDADQLCSYDQHLCFCYMI